MKDDALYFSRYSNQYEEDKFTIDLYPTIASEQINTEFDTVEVNDTTWS